jgi:hypothetical protein
VPRGVRSAALDRSMLIDVVVPARVGPAAARAHHGASARPARPGVRPLRSRLSLQCCDHSLFYATWPMRGGAAQRGRRSSGPTRLRAAASNPISSAAGSTPSTRTRGGALRRRALLCRGQGREALERRWRWLASRHISVSTATSTDHLPNASSMPPGRCAALPLRATLGGASVVRSLPWMLRGAGVGGATAETGHDWSARCPYNHQPLRGCCRVVFTDAERTLPWQHTS